MPLTSYILQVVANAKLLVEGIDVPTIDMVVLAEPVHSPTKILQMAARAQRPSAGKACGYVMVPERRVYSAPTKLPGSTARDALVCKRGLGARNGSGTHGRAEA